ncbi:MAG TPA: STAS domain-containing protein [Thermoleophilaceae bacterium]|nr:STAS domain-containing protein [Thermoleophilaceae bacterium]
MSRLTFEPHRDEAMTRLALAGEFDLSNAAQVEDALKQLEDDRPDLLVLDLRELTFMDSTGLRVMVSADARARDEGRRLAVVQGPESVHRVFRITGLDDHLEIYETPEAAVIDGTGATS